MALWLHHGLLAFFSTLTWFQAQRPFTEVWNLKTEGCAVAQGNALSLKLRAEWGQPGAPPSLRRESNAGGLGTHSSSGALCSGVVFTGPVVSEGEGDR